MDFEENKQQQPDSSDGNLTNSDANRQDMAGESFEDLLEASFDYEPPRRGEIRSATILQIEPNEIIVDMGAKQDGIVMAQDLERLDEDFRKSLKVGQEVPVYVLNPRDSDANLIVSINMGLQQYDWDEARKLMDKDEVVEVTVTGHNRGGVLVKWNMLEGFIPSSHMVTVSAGLQGNERREALDALRGEKIGVKVIEVDQDRRRLIFSEREAQREWRAQQKARLLAELNEGDTVKGTVTGLRDFGAFVNLGGADGLIHVSELAWHRVDHPKDVLRVGQEIEVYVLSLDRETNRIALSRKRLLPDPWDDALDRYFEGMLVEGTVTNVVDFGAFIALDDGLEGLLHLSEMGDGSLKEPYSYVKKGDRLQLRISRLEPDQRRVGFTQRWGVDQEEPLESDAPIAPLAEVTDEAEVEAEPEEAAEEVEEAVVADELAEVSDEADEADEPEEAEEPAEPDEADEAEPEEAAEEVEEAVVADELAEVSDEADEADEPEEAEEPDEAEESIEPDEADEAEPEEAAEEVEEAVVAGELAEVSDEIEPDEVEEAEEPDEPDDLDEADKVEEENEPDDTD
jgi:small subunit ribosomal protein S1